MESSAPLRSTSGGPILSVVIVNYRSWPDSVRLVGSLDVTSGLSEIVVVDNDSQEPIPQLQPEVRLIRQPDNGGFSSGVNSGWRASRGAWLLVLNPDVVAGPGFLDQVLERIARLDLREDRRPGVVGFKLINLDGSGQPSVGVFPSLARTAWEQLIPRARRKYQPDWRLQAGPVDWVTGACMLVRAKLLEELGGMDEDFFLYHEEVALCRSAQDRGWSVEYDPTLTVVHLRPLQNRPISPKMRVVTRHAKLLYFRKHRPGWQFRTLCATVRLEAMIRGALSRLRGRVAEARSWKAVGQVARRLQTGEGPRGRAVLTLAEAVEDRSEDPEDHSSGPFRSGNAPHWRPRGSRLLPPRKDGTA